MHLPQAQHTSEGNAAPPPERRTFLKWLTHGLGALFGAALGVPGVAYLIDARNRPIPQADLKTVARLDELVKDVPFQAVVRDIRKDAWTLHPNDVLGRVWLIRREDVEGKPRVEAFTTICPHLGCSINYEKPTNQEKGRFICPCHNGQFDDQGVRILQPGTINPAPRNMDSLECLVVEGGIQVKYVNFQAGKESKEPRT